MVPGGQGSRYALVSLAYQSNPVPESLNGY